MMRIIAIAMVLVFAQISMAQTHLAERQNLNFGTPAGSDGESMHSGFTKVEADLQYLFEMADTVVRKVDLVANLATLDKPIDNELVATRGWRAEDDGGANVYRYDLASTATCNGGTVLDGIGGSNVPATSNASYAGTGTGRFFAVHKTWMNAKQWGTNNDGFQTDEHRLTAWGAATDQPGLDLGDLSYFIQSTGWTITASGKKVTGRGAVVTQQTGSSATVAAGFSGGEAAAVLVTGSNVVFEGIEFNGGAQNVTGISIEGDGGVLRRCTIRNSAGVAGIAILANDVKVEGCEIYDHTNDGISFGGGSLQASRSWLKDSYVHDNGNGTFDAAVFLTGTELQASGNLIQANFGDGVTVQDSSGDVTMRVTVTGNELRNNNGGVRVESLGIAVEEILVSNNQIIDCADYGVVGLATGKIRILGNHIVNNFGTTGADPGDGISLQSANNITVSGNFIRTGDVGDGVELFGTFNNMSVLGNTITNGASGITIATNHSFDTSDAVTVNGNHISSSQGGAIGIRAINSGLANATNVKISNNYIDAATDVSVNDTAGGGDTGWELFGNTSSKASPTVVLSHPELKRDDGNSWNGSVFWGTAIPTTGTYAVGDRVWNENPATGISHWLCTVAGTPGTWEQAVRHQIVTETVALTGAETSTSLAIPSGAIVRAVKIDVTATVSDSTGDDTWNASLSGGSTIGIARNEAAASGTEIYQHVLPEQTNSVTEVTIKPNAGTFTSGTVNVRVEYEYNTGTYGLTTLPALAGWTIPATFTVDLNGEYDITFDADSYRPTTTNDVFVDPIGGDDANNGSAGNAVETLVRAHALATGVTGFRLYPGTHDASAVSLTWPTEFSIIAEPVSPAGLGGRPAIADFVLSDSGKTFYVKGIDFTAGMDSTGGTRFFEDCSFNAAFAQGASFAGSGEAICMDCQALGNGTDGFDYTGSHHALEIRCVGSNNGDGTADNGSTAHSTVKIVRYKGTYENNFRNVHDVNDAKSYLIDCTVRYTRGLYLAVASNSFNVGAGFFATASESAEVTIFGGNCSGGAVVDFYVDNVDATLNVSTTTDYSTTDGTVTEFVISE